MRRDSGSSPRTDPRTGRSTTPSRRPTWSAGWGTTTRRWRPSRSGRLRPDPRTNGGPSFPVLPRPCFGGIRSDPDRCCCCCPCRCSPCRWRRSRRLPAGERFDRTTDGGRGSVPPEAAGRGEEVSSRSEVRRRRSGASPRCGSSGRICRRCWLLRRLTRRPWTRCERCDCSPPPLPCLCLRRHGTMCGRCCSAQRRRRGRRCGRCEWASRSDRGGRTWRSVGCRGSRCGRCLLD
mmetsp:Transcript_8214/g.24612  ORF Transcript_8214/g.24612 Transcript_8214/m.24612 type:complete len:234 (-) Transcript_8214:118-819(-)